MDLFCLMLVSIACGMEEKPSSPLRIGSQRELFVDDCCIERLNKVQLVLHQPTSAGVALQFDSPWEGKYCAYVTVFKDGDLFRMYYRGLPVSSHEEGTEVTCYAESKDGIHWKKPSLGLFEVCGTRENNVILANNYPFSHNFSPFLDTKPDVPPQERYKAVAGTEASGLVGFVSENGIHWRKFSETPLIQKGHFDSQNVVFWSEKEQKYCCYFRVWQENIRRISRSVSDDFIHWSEPQLIEYSRGPLEHLYTNQTQPYFRAPHIYLALAARLLPDRRILTHDQVASLGLEETYAKDCSDAVLLSSRQPHLFDRTFMEAFIRPGFGTSHWVSRTNYPACGIIQTGENELSIFVQRHYAQSTHYLERMILRLDGFASVRGFYDGGELITKPLIFDGGKLSINYSTSAAGEIRIELQDESGNSVPGFTLAECDIIIGDEINRIVSWNGNSDLSAVSDRPIRIRFFLKDADLYSFQFS